MESHNFQILALARNNNQSIKKKNITWIYKGLKELKLIDFKNIEVVIHLAAAGVSPKKSSIIELEEIRIGLASGNPRMIGREGGVMGVMLGQDGKKLGGVEINEVVPQAAGDRAGLLAKDLILSIDGRRVFTKEQLGKVVSSKDPGDMINLEVSRKNKKRKIKVTLGHSSVTFELFNRNLQMSGPVSKRKDNFPLILQHDLPLPKEGMGGPLFNLEGKCIGINIARVDRVTTFALPTKILLPYLKDWLPDAQNILPERITQNDTEADL